MRCRGCGRTVHKVWFSAYVVEPGGGPLYDRLKAVEPKVGETIGFHVYGEQTVLEVKPAGKADWIPNVKQATHRVWCGAYKTCAEAPHFCTLRCAARFAERLCR